MNAPPVDLAIVGAGPGGYVAALRAAGLGMLVVLVERAALHAHAVRRAAAFGITSGAMVVDYAAVVKRRDRVVARLRGGVQTLLRARGVEAEGSRMIVFGGAKDDNRTLILNDTWAYYPATNSWTELKPDTAPAARCVHSMGYDPSSGRIILFGGVVQSLGTEAHDTWSYRP